MVGKEAKNKKAILERRKEHERQEQELEIRKHSGIYTILVVMLIVFISGFIGLESYAKWRVNHEWQFPIKTEWIGFVREIRHEVEVISPIAEEVAEEVVEPEASQTWAGTASFYTFDGCLGCNQQRIMANGEVLDDMKKTLAFNHLPMNTEVKVTNLSNGVSTMAVVTDTGGFEKYDRIADLSYATKEILDCNDLCQVRIEVF